MLQKKLFAVVFLVLVALFMGCTSNSLQSLRIKGDPLTQIYREPGVELEAYRTFSLFPYSALGKESKMNDIVEIQMLFFLRNKLESKGYLYVRPEKIPDFWATIEVFTEVKSQYIPPTTTTVSKWVPGETIRTHHDVSIYGSRTYFGSGTSTTYVPGHMTTETETKPGYTQNSIYSNANISIFDAKTFERVWISSGVASSDNSDARISSQFLIDELVREFPSSGSTPARTDVVPMHALLDFNYDILTIDGNNYYPIVVEIGRKGAALNAGMRMHDIILDINGQSTLNRPYSEIQNMLSGGPEQVVRLTMKRRGTTAQVDIFKPIH